MRSFQSAKRLNADEKMKRAYRIKRTKKRLSYAKYQLKKYPSSPQILKRIQDLKCQVARILGTLPENDLGRVTCNAAK